MTNTTKNTLLFGNHVEVYDEFRPSYPNIMYDKILSLSPSENYCIDVGAGSGIATKDLLSYYDKVIAIEPDFKMFNFLLKRFGDKIEVYNSNFSQCDNIQDSVDSIICASSFHWLDHSKFLHKAYDSLSHNGIIAICNVNIYPIFEKSLKSIVESEFNRNWKPFVHSKLDDLIHKENVINKLNSVKKFSAPNLYSFDNIQFYSTSKLIGFLRSLSYVNLYLNSLSNSSRLNYLADLSDKIASLGIDFHKVNFQVNLFVIKKI